MPRALLLLSAAAVFGLGAAACGGGDDMPTGEPIPFDSARALGFARHLAEDIGPRPSGSEAARAAADYIAAEFSNARFGVFRLEFAYEADPNRPAEVVVGGTSLPAVTAGGSAVGGVSGAAADIGTGDSVLTVGSLAGKVAVARRGGNSSFYEKYQAADGAGAAALIIVNTEPGLLTANLGATAEIPVVTMEQNDAVAVLAAAASGAVVAVQVAEPQLIEGTNVIARSRTAHSCIYVLTANYDTLPGSPGANQNASGIAVMLELAHQFSVMDELPAVCFMALDAGYTRGAGALSYLQTVTETSRPATVIEVHSVGREGELFLRGDRLLQQDAEALAESLRIDTESSASAFSPATEPFRALNIPVLEISREPAATGPADSADGLRESALDGAAQVAGLLLIQVSAKLEP